MLANQKEISINHLRMGYALTIQQYRSLFQVGRRNYSVFIKSSSYNYKRPTSLLFFEQKLFFVALSSEKIHWSVLS